MMTGVNLITYLYEEWENGIFVLEKVIVGVFNRNYFKWCII